MYFAMGKITTIKFAERVGLTYGRINQLIQSGDIEAEKVGRDYLIDEQIVSIIKNRPEKRGRKPKNKKLETISGAR